MFIKVRTVTAIIFIASILIALVIIISGTGCDNNPANPANVRSSLIQISPTAICSSIVDYGNGVYYFNYYKADFGNALSAFISLHPELEVVSIAANGTGSYGRTIGYFVVFKSKV